MEKDGFFSIEEELKKLPESPGVYLMHNSLDEIIYVGKAIKLKNRVRQYFQSPKGKTEKIRQMVKNIAWFEYIVTDSELEALVLECNLIKDNRPKYNTMLMDDKGYPFIKVTVEEDYPRILLSREMKKDKSRYFGPYTSSFAVKQTIELLQKIYLIRNCRLSLPKDIGKYRPCLNSHMGLCASPCSSNVTKEEYRQNINRAIAFLNGDYAGVLKYLEDKMQKAAEELDFEGAIKWRELINGVRHVTEKQKITDSSMPNRDIIACATDGKQAVVQVFFVRDGKMLGQDHFRMSVSDSEEYSETEYDMIRAFVLSDTEEHKNPLPPTLSEKLKAQRKEVLESFIKQFYSGTPFVPKEIYVQEEIGDREIIEKWLSGLLGSHVTLFTPQKGGKEKFMELAASNATRFLKEAKEKVKREELRTLGAVKELEELLCLSGLRRFEAFDISNISGFESVGSMVVFVDGKPKKNDYRKFKIKTVSGPDDYASMEEVLTRRFERYLKEKDSGEGGFSVPPDLILMDGGKGQVNVCEEVLKNLGLSVPVCGMVKDDHHNTRGLYYQNTEMPLDIKSEGFHLITRIQDEAHRFAITYHRGLHTANSIKSVLIDIPGIGEKRKKALMRAFENIDGIKNASAEEIAALDGFTRAAAESVYSYLHDK